VGKVFVNTPSPFDDFLNVNARISFGGDRVNFSLFFDTNTLKARISFEVSCCSRNDVAVRNGRMGKTWFTASPVYSD